MTYLGSLEWIFHKIGESIQAAVFWAGGDVNTAKSNFLTAMRQFNLITTGFTGSILGEIQQISYRNSMNELSGVLYLIGTPSFRDELASQAAIVDAKLKSIGFSTFRVAWESARQLISLQARLYLEQRFWNLGDPWRALVTGFKPVL